MASNSPTKNVPDWVGRWPEAFAVVTGFFPEARPKGGKPDCRPLLVTQVLRAKSSGAIHLRIAYGTSKIKLQKYANRDLIIQNLSDLDACGLMTPTRFVIEPRSQLVREWTPENFAPWGGCNSPRRGRLPDHLKHEYAWLMAQYPR